MIKWVDIANTNQEEFKQSGFDTWNEYVADIKVQQAFKKLEELGYYHDSGLYGWLKKDADNALINHGEDK